tara:strand:- start:1341 stop:1805 length:465 start_codon:yes stop_codon:yes gene_type:complete
MKLSMKSIKPTTMNKFLSLSNVIGLILAVLIVFDLKVENDFKQVLNSPPGMILSLVLLVLIFIFMNPIVGLLFLIYLYECVKDTSLHPSKFVNSQSMKNTILNTINGSNSIERKQSDKVEMDTIRKMAPIVKKMESPNAVFIPHVENPIPYDTI